MYEGNNIKYSFIIILHILYTRIIYYNNYCGVLIIYFDRHPLIIIIFPSVTGTPSVGIGVFILGLGAAFQRIEF